MEHMLHEIAGDATDDEESKHNHISKSGKTLHLLREIHRSANENKFRKIEVTKVQRIFKKKDNLYTDEYNSLIELRASLPQFPHEAYQYLSSIKKLVTSTSSFEKRLKSDVYFASLLPKIQSFLEEHICSLLRLQNYIERKTSEQNKGFQRQSKQFLNLRPDCIEQEKLNLWMNSGGNYEVSIVEESEFKIPELKDEYDLKRIFRNSQLNIQENKTIKETGNNRKEIYDDVFEFWKFCSAKPEKEVLESLYNHCRDLNKALIDDKVDWGKTDDLMHLVKHHASKFGVDTLIDEKEEAKEDCENCCILAEKFSCSEDIFNQRINTDNDIDKPGTSYKRHYDSDEDSQDQVMSKKRKFDHIADPNLSEGETDNEFHPSQDLFSSQSSIQYEVFDNRSEEVLLFNLLDALRDTTENNLIQYNRMIARSKEIDQKEQLEEELDSTAQEMYKRFSHYLLQEKLKESTPQEKLKDSQSQEKLDDVQGEENIIGRKKENVANLNKNILDHFSKLQDPKFKEDIEALTNKYFETLDDYKEFCCEKKKIFHEILPI